MPSKTIVQPVSHDRTAIRIAEGYSVVWFKLSNGGAEIVILDPNATECTRLVAAPPEPGHRLRIATPDPDIFEVIYEAIS